jgi:Tol biopolymer transport system component
VEVREGSDGDIWAFDLERRTQSRLAFGPGRQMEPAWSPDGRTLAFRDINMSLLQLVPADGSRPPRPVGIGFLPMFTPDGRYLACSRRGPRDGRPEIALVPLVPGADTIALAGAGGELHASPAPHAAFLAYESDESGTPEIYLRPYPEGGGRWQVSTKGGNRPLWSAAGDRLYYFHERKFHEVDVQLAPTVRLGTPRLLFDMDALRIRGYARHTIVPTRDPDRFLAIRDIALSDGPGSDAVVVQSWTSEFRGQR